MSNVVIFEAAGQLELAMALPQFQRDGLVRLDAYPYRTLERGKRYVAVFVGRTTDSARIVAIGRVIPGDLSGASNRNLEFDLCRRVAPDVPVPRNSERYSDVAMALEQHRALDSKQGEALLKMISKFSEDHADVVAALRTQMEPKTVEGAAGYLLACEQDAVALSLKAANLHGPLAKLSTWSAGSPDAGFIAGLSEAREPEAFRSSPDHEVLPAQDSGSETFAWMRVDRGETYGVTVINIRPGSTEPIGTDLIHLQPKLGSLVLLHYGADGTYSPVVDEVDTRYAGGDNPSDPRLAPRPGFVKFAAYRHGNFEATRDRLLGGRIHVAGDLRAWQPRPDDRFASRRHLSSSTFAALLSGGWLGGRGAGHQQAREVVDLALRANHAVVVAVQGECDPPSLF